MAQLGHDGWKRLEGLWVLHPLRDWPTHVLWKVARALLERWRGGAVDVWTVRLVLRSTAASKSNGCFRERLHAPPPLLLLRRRCHHYSPPALPLSGVSAPGRDHLVHADAAIRRRFRESCARRPKERPLHSCGVRSLRRGRKKSNRLRIGPAVGRHDVDIMEVVSRVGRSWVKSGAPAPRHSVSTG